MALKKYNGGESPRNGVCEFIYKKMLIDLGWEYVDLKAERTSLADADLPNVRSKMNLPSCGKEFFPHTVSRFFFAQ
jgi:hypothetical protein